MLAVPTVKAGKDQNSRFEVFSTECISPSHYCRTDNSCWTAISQEPPVCKNCGNQNTKASMLSLREISNPNSFKPIQFCGQFSKLYRLCFHIFVFFFNFKTFFAFRLFAFIFWYVFDSIKCDQCQPLCSCGLPLMGIISARFNFCRPNPKDLSIVKKIWFYHLIFVLIATVSICSLRHCWAHFVLISTKSCYPEVNFWSSIVTNKNATFSSDKQCEFYFALRNLLRSL